MIDMEKESPFVKFINKCNVNRMIAQPIGLVKPRRVQRKYVIAPYQMGDKYAKALGESL
jgi:hypothetical protein